MIKSEPENEKMTETNDQIIMYGTTWCYDTRRAREIFEKNGIPYQWIDIGQDPEARKFVEQVNNGYRSVPTIVFPDGSILTEPSNSELRKKLGLT